MTKKQELYYLIERYIEGEYDIQTFCSVFYNIYYPDIPKDELNSTEYKLFDNLGEIVSRYSSNQEDFIKCPNVYYSSEDVIEAIHSIYKKLF